MLSCRELRNIIFCNLRTFMWSKKITAILVRGAKMTNMEYYNLLELMGWGIGHLAPCLDISLTDAIIRN